LSGESQIPQDDTYSGANRRSSNLINVLGRTWDQICLQAVTPGEIMVVLEGAGLNDQIARERYGCLDLLDCAEQLYLRVPYRASSSITPPQDVAPPTWLPLLRGLVYLFPAAWLPVTTYIWEIRSATTGWLIATLFCWGWGQLIAHLGYGALGRQQPGQTAGFIRILSVVGLLATAGLSALVALFLHLPAEPTVAVGILTATYLFSSYALLICGRMMWLFSVSLLSAFLGLALTLVPANLVSLRDYAASWILALAVSAPLGLALLVTRRAERLVWPSIKGLMPSIGYALYGWNCAGFLAWATMTSVGIEPLKGLLNTLILAPLVLSTGVMEWLVERLFVHLRSLASRPLRREALIRQGLKALAGSVASYILLLALLYGVLAIIASDLVSLAHLTGQLLFGVATMLSVILLTVARLTIVVTSWLVCFGLLVILNFMPSNFPLSPTGIFLVDIVVLLSALLYSAVTAFYDVNSYR